MLSGVAHYNNNNINITDCFLSLGQTFIIFSICHFSEDQALSFPDNFFNPFCAFSKPGSRDEDDNENNTAIPSECMNTLPWDAPLMTAKENALHPDDYK